MTVDVDSIGLQQLGNPRAVDPLCFASTSRPLVLRASPDPDDPGNHGTSPKSGTLDQLLFHLIRDGKDNDVVRACSPEQRAFIAGFLEYLMEQYGAELDECTYSDDILKAYDIWSVG